jgi:hypothetical protein
MKKKTYAEKTEELLAWVPAAIAENKRYWAARAAEKAASAHDPASAREPLAPVGYGIEYRHNAYGRDIAVVLPPVVRAVDPQSREGLCAEFHRTMANWNVFRAVGAARVSPKQADKMDAAFRQEASWLMTSIQQAT